MKNAAAFLAAFILLFTVSSAAAQTVTAMATVTYTESYASRVFRAIPGYDRETGILDVRLVIPEIFSREDAESLQSGDGIITEGREVRILSVERSGYGDILLNEGMENPVRLAEDLQSNYRTMRQEEEECIYIEMDRLQLPVTGSLLLLDMNDPEAIDVPVVYSVEKFIRMKTEDPDFCAVSVYVVPDENGSLAVIYRLYMP